MLIVVPLGLFIGAVVFDGIYLMRGSSTLATVGYWNIAGGVAGGLLAAVFGLIGWLAIPAGTRAKRIGLLHAHSNVLAILGFALAFWMRYASRDLPRRLGYSASKSSRWSWALAAAGSVESSLTASAWVLIATRT